jgi:serine O-acetyltransferase
MTTKPIIHPPPPPRLPLPSDDPSRVRGQRDENPPDIGLGALLAEDFHTYDGRLSAPGFWAVAVHRFGNWRMGVRKPFRAPLTLLYRTAFQAIRLGFGIDLPYDTKLGRRVRIDQHGAVIIGARSIGNDVVIRHSAILGVMRRDATSEKPIIEDGVEIGPRACVIGAVTIGHDTLVCANTVVPMNVPANSTVLGVPARIVDLRQHLGSLPSPAPMATPTPTATATPAPASSPASSPASYTAAHD